MSLETISLFFGCMLIFIGVIGGGIEVKEIKQRITILEKGK